MFGSLPNCGFECRTLLGTDDPKVISTYVTEDPGLDPARVRTQVAALQARCRDKGIRFDLRYAYYQRSTDLVAKIVSFDLGFAL